MMMIVKLVLLNSLSRTDDYHTYRDTTAFLYRITLTRPNIAENKNERFVLHVRVTHASSCRLTDWSSSMRRIAFPTAML